MFGLLQAVAGNVELQDHAMVDQPVDRRSVCAPGGAGIRSIAGEIVGELPEIGRFGGGELRLRAVKSRRGGRIFGATLTIYSGEEIFALFPDF